MAGGSAGKAVFCRVDMARKLLEQLDYYQMPYWSDLCFASGMLRMTKASTSLSAVALVALLAGGCDDHRPPAGKKVIELSWAETGPLCKYLQDVVGEFQREVRCDGGRHATTPVFSVYECQEDFAFDNEDASNFNCGVTVGEYEACAEAIADDPCLQLLPNPPSACAFFDDLSCGRIWLENSGGY